MSDSFKYGLCTAAFFLAFCSAVSQIFPFEYYTIQNGLSGNQVHWIMQDKQGFIWIATNNGLSQFDGITFKNFTVLDGLPVNDVSVIIEVPVREHDRIYILGTKGTVTIEENGRFFPVEIPFSGKDNGIERMERGDSNTVWCSSSDEVFLIRDRAVQTIKLPFSFHDHFDDHRLLSADGGIWISDGPEFHFCTLSDSERLKEEYCLHFPSTVYDNILCKDKEMFVTLADSSLYHVHEGKIIAHRKLASSGWCHLADDDQGKLWITSDIGLFSLRKDRFETDSLEQWTNENGLPDQMVTHVFFDSERNMWVGTWINGLAKLSQQGLYHIPLDNLVKDRGAAADPCNRIWITSHKGYWEINIANYLPVKKVFHPWVEDVGIVYVDPDTSLWTMTYTLGIASHLYRYRILKKSDSTELVRQPIPIAMDSLIKNDVIYNVIVDHSKRLWCNNYPEGILVFDLHTMRRITEYQVPLQIPDPSVRASCEDSQNRIWFGGYDRGLCFVDGKESVQGKVTVYTEKSCLPDNHIRSIYEDKKGRLWFGTRYQGAVVYDGVHWVSITLKDGLKSNAVWCITGDDQNHIWLGTDAGFEPVDINTLQPVPWQGFNIGKVFSCGFLPNKLLWCVTSTDLYVADSKYFRPSNIESPIIIKKFQVNGNITPVDSLIVLPYDKLNT